MRKILIFGNSGSGKSTLAAHLSEAHHLAHLDLDVLAWLPPETAEEPPRRAALADSKAQIDVFVHSNPGWVIEGCYTDLLDLLADQASEAVFLNLDVEQCITNARHRPWEPHKYDSKEAQDENLGMLIDWIRQYHERTDVFSQAAHHAFYDRFKGDKSMITENPGI